MNNGVEKRKSTHPYASGDGPKALKFLASINEGETDLNKRMVQKCKWQPNIDLSQSPHCSISDWRQNDKILPNILHAIGNTKLVKLNKIPQSLGIKCEILVKCEFLSPGGSVKDRIGLRMVEDAEHQGILKPGYTLIEPTSGNTGVGLALAAAVKGYRMIIVLSEKMSNEKVAVLKALGAEIVRVPITEDSYSPNGLFGVSYRLKKEIPNSVILDQYSNPGNPLAHYETTAAEILDACDGKLDVLVGGAGTGGTISGLGRKMKDASPNTLIVAADPYGSILARPDELNKTEIDFYEVEGVGYDFIPGSMDHKAVDKWIKVADKEALNMARRLIREEGLLCGGSSGTALVAALEVAKTLKEDQRVVVILPDNIRNYLTKFISDNWMEERGLKTAVNQHNHWWWDRKVLELDASEIRTVNQDLKTQSVLDLMKEKDLNIVAVVDASSEGIVGVVTIQDLLKKVVNNEVDLNEPVTKVSSHIYPKAAETTKLGVISRILEIEPYVLIVRQEGLLEKPRGIVTASNLLKFTTNNKH